MSANPLILFTIALHSTYSISQKSYWESRNIEQLSMKHTHTVCLLLK